MGQAGLGHLLRVPPVHQDGAGSGGGAVLARGAATRTRMGGPSFRRAPFFSAENGTSCFFSLGSRATKGKTTFFEQEQGTQHPHTVLKSV